MEAIHPLKAYRESQEPPLTQEQLAFMLGISVASVSRWETGERKPEVDHLPKIMKTTGIPADKLRPDLAGLFTPFSRDRPRRKTGRAA